MIYELTFNDTDLGELQRFIDDLFNDNSLYFERLVSALARIGLKTRIESQLALFPNIEVAKRVIVSTLQSIKGVRHGKAQKENQ